MGSDVTSTMILVTLLRWIGICAALLILLTFADGWVTDLIAKL